MPNVISKLNAHRKSLTALITGWLGWGAVVITSKPAPVTASEWLQLGIVTATAAGVYAITNEAA